MLKIVFLDALTLGDVPNLNIFNNLGEYTQYDMTPKEKVIERIGDADILITNKVLITKEIMDSCPRLKLICLSATGMNNVDLEYARTQQIEVKNVAGYSTESVVQATFTMLLYVLCKPKYFNDYVYSGKYSQSEIFTHIGPGFWEIKGKTFGIIGLGAIGKRVAEVATAFGARVIYYSTSGKNNAENYQRVELDELMKTSDIISVHSPLNESTNGLIDDQKIRLMQPHAILLNAGRGGIIVEKDLARAIDENIIGGAGIDVMTQEPIPSNHPYLAVKNKENLYLAPHIAWISIEARTKLVEGIYKNIVDFTKKINMKASR